MTPVDPTLEDISEHGFRAGPTPHRVANVLADHLLTLIEASDEHCHRLDALESQARPFQEDGHVAGRSIAARVADRLALELVDCMAERDAAIDRADEAERELSKARAEIQRLGGGW